MFRRRSLPLLRRSLALVAVLALAACGGDERSGLGSSVRRGLGRGEAYARRLVAAGHAGTPDAQSTIALGYLEQLRLGLGSPFRLADYALHDPRLGDAVRRPLAWALLDRILTGADYRVDPAALDGVGTSAAGNRPGSGRYHLRLIDGAVAEADDPRAGELAVRLAYELAAAEGSVWRRAPEVVAQAAALARDRALARNDARRLLREAQRERADALDMLVRWRAERRFEVEAPRLGPPAPAVEREALDVAPRLAAAIRLLGPRLEGVALVGAAAAEGSAPLLGPAAARRLLALADSSGAPPETPVVVAVRMHGKELLAAPGLTAAQRRDRERLLRDAPDGERFAAAVDLAVDRAGAGDSGLARAQLAVAAALRSYAQEEIWFPGFGGPSARELAERFGVRVAFDPGVPAGWRPYYRRMLEQSLSDLQRVLPAPDFRGLRVRFGRNPLGDRALALHDPRRRILYLPPGTGAGTIAHELAHDLDWQVALRRYGVHGDYASDYVTRSEPGRLASSLSGLANGSLVAPTPGDAEPPSHARRPAEVFARSMEWFVAVSLAHEGIMDGYLSSVQDDMLTGYGSVQPPDVTGGAALALVDILDDVAPVYPATRRWYLRAYGPGRVLSATDLLRRVLDPPGAGAGRGAGRARLVPAESTDSAGTGGYPSLAALGFAAVERARAHAVAAIDAWICSAPGAMFESAMDTRRRELVALAASARARGIAIRLADRAAGRDGRLWVERRLYGTPWPEVPLDTATQRTLAPLVDAARAVDTAGLLRPRDAFTLARPAARCGGTLTAAVPSVLLR